jgi:hypothetical protein
MITFISAGFFFVLVGAIFALTPGLLHSSRLFLQDFKLVQFPHTANIWFPAPSSPSAHLTFYNAVGLFCLIWGLFEFFILAAKFLMNLPAVSKARTMSDVIFWLGTYYLIHNFLNSSLTLSSWFTFWSMIIILSGVSLVARTFFLALRTYT